jgi:hypothetical protein
MLFEEETRKKKESGRNSVRTTGAMIAMDKSAKAQGAGYILLNPA